MHGDVIQVAERILQLFQPGDESVPPLIGLFAGKNGSEKFRGITHLFGLDPQLMAPARRKLAQMFAALADLLPAALQFVGRGLHDRTLSQRTRKLVPVLRPVAKLDPGRGAEDKIAEAVGVACRTHAGIGLRAPLPQILQQRGEPRPVAAAVRS